MFSEKRDKISENLSRYHFEEAGRKVVSSSDFEPLSVVFRDYFWGSESKKFDIFGYLRENTSFLASKAFNHDYSSWGIIAYNLGNLKKEDLEETKKDPSIISDLGFYKAALAFLSCLSLSDRSDLDLNVSTQTLDSILLKGLNFYKGKPQGKHSFSSNWGSVKEIPFSHFYLIWNLVKNANEEFGGAEITNGRVSLNYQPNDLNTILTVSDSGRGIKPDLLETIFTNYTSKPDGEKGGFGLEGCLKIINRLKGNVIVASRYQDGDAKYYTPNKDFCLSSVHLEIPEGYSTTFRIQIPNRA